MYKYPCRGCEKRTLGCHQNCEEYQAVKQSRIEATRRRREYYLSETYEIERAKKIKGRKKMG